MERGRVLLEAADKLTTDAETIARGWETHTHHCDRSAGTDTCLFPVNRQTGGKSQYPTGNHHRSAGGGVGTAGAGRADIVIAPDMHFRSSSEINSRKLYTLMNVYVAALDHPIHQEPEPLSEVTRVKYRGSGITDTAGQRPVLTVQLLDKQPRLTVSTIE